MQRQRGELVPIGEGVSGLDDALVPAIRDATPQARRGFTLADQVNQLVSASEADPDRGFMARLMALCSLPRTNPGNRIRYKRVNGPYTLYMTAGGGNKLPYGNLPRLMLAWISTEAVKTQSRVLVLGNSNSGFMRELGIYNSSGGDADPLPEAALLHGGQEFELGLDGGDRRLLLQQHGDFDHPLPVTLDGAHVALGQGYLHAKGCEIEHP